ncbi:MAG: hypothetical protein KDD50_16000 [Bdellovibrionales bacterium]|nr:hypothetical protein [Bdellovibrionales bacterium]
MFDLKNFAYYFSLSVIFMFAIQVTTACSPKARKTPIVKGGALSKTGENGKNGKLSDSLYGASGVQSYCVDINNELDEEGTHLLTNYTITIYTEVQRKNGKTDSDKLVFSSNGEIGGIDNNLKISDNFTNMDEEIEDSSLELPIPLVISKDDQSPRLTYDRVDALQINVKDKKIQPEASLKQLDENPFSDASFKTDEQCKDKGVIKLDQFFKTLTGKDSIDTEVTIDTKYVEKTKSFVIEMTYKNENKDIIFAELIYNKKDAKSTTLADRLKAKK